MPYTPTSWVSGTTPVDATEMNNLETQYVEATNSLEQDLLTAFVLSGLVATKDGTIANQLDVTAGVAFLKQADNSLRRRAPAAQNFTTATPSTTYYLDLNPDGTWSWGTTHSGQSNYLTICSVTTDASGNISIVTDARTLGATLLSSMAGTLRLPAATLAGATIWTSANQGSGSGLNADLLDGHDSTYFSTLIIGSAGGGAAGSKIWVGTTDPGSSASEGDIWVKG
jgi:hypothetical protein